MPFPAEPYDAVYLGEPIQISLEAGDPWTDASVIYVGIREFHAGNGDGDVNQFRMFHDPRWRRVEQLH